MGEKFLAQLVKEPTEESKILVLLFVNRGPVGGAKVGSRVGDRDHEMLDCSILVEACRRVRRAAGSDFRRTDFGLFGPRLRASAGRKLWRAWEPRKAGNTLRKSF